MAKISAFVIAYNRAELLRACLRRVRFVDELIVVDKSSTDETPEVARELADRYEVVPWSPVVEDTRAYAQSLCSHEWIICLDDRRPRHHLVTVGELARDLGGLVCR